MMHAMLTAGEAAKLAGVSKTTIARAVHCGRIPGFKLPDGSYAISKSGLELAYDPARLSLRQAADVSGRSKSTIHRAIQAGVLPAQRSGDGSYQIHEADLFSVYGGPTQAQEVCVPRPLMDELLRTAERVLGHYCPPAETLVATAIRLAIADLDNRSRLKGRSENE